MARSPILPIRVTPHGAFGYLRLTSAQGACGTRGHPCGHYGVDLGAAEGTVAYAPIDGVVIATGDGSKPPFTGYGPFVILMQGSDGLYHLLSHLKAEWPIFVGQKLKEGQPVGRVSGARHVHWEVRGAPYPSKGDNRANNLDPLAWLEGKRRGAGGDGFAIALLLAAGLGLWAYHRRKKRLQTAAI